MRALRWCARHGRWLLIAGLVIGIALPGLARAMAGAIVPLIALLLFFAALRIGPRAAIPRRAALPRALGLTLILQLVAPLVAAGLLTWAGLLHTAGGLGTVLVLAGAPITGAPGLALMSGADPAAALRQLVLGTALLPLTAVPVFALLPIFPDMGAVALGAARLLVVIALAGGSAFALHAAMPQLRRQAAVTAIDGALALSMALVVIGLMAAVGPAILALDMALPTLVALAFALNLGPAIAVWHSSRLALPAPEASALAIAAGNRNLAIFLAALPPEMVTQLLLFVGCYQVPMYLTPLILPRLLATLRQRYGGRDT
ncbi:hypothetical protein DC366_12725 [Pelagivirga sediminicola]|uniref:Bile acid:sodium symporter n=1 Tax=Pelagivirga sediminicola TaxID=2170575 RepID=A0A2T7G5I4_9RHOB|nr:hypothetical protein DC366_12725 [Pelagivirga sediminicola]